MPALGRSSRGVLGELWEGPGRVSDRLSRVLGGSQTGYLGSWEGGLGDSYRGSQTGYLGSGRGLRQAI